MNSLPTYLQFRLYLPPDIHIHPLLYFKEALSKPILLLSVIFLKTKAVDFSPPACPVFVSNLEKKKKGWKEEDKRKKRKAGRVEEAD